VKGCCIVDGHAPASPIPRNTTMKAHFQLAQAYIALHSSFEALEAAKKAHELCVEDIYAGGKGGVVLRRLVSLCWDKKEVWEMREEKRLRERPGLLEEAVKGLERERDEKIMGLGSKASRGDEESVEEYRGKVEEVRRVFAKEGEKEGERRVVPDWCLDGISFSAMVDPVVVSCLPFPFPLPLFQKCMLTRGE